MESSLFFKSKGKKRKFLKNYVRSLNKTTKYLIITIMIISILSCLITYSIYLSYKTSNNYLSQSLCKDLIDYSVNKALAQQEQNNIMGFFYHYIPKDLIAFILIAIGLGWILHGVGFYIIKR